MASGSYRAVHSGQSIMKLAWCPESGPADWAENLNKKLLNGQRWLCPAPHASGYSVPP